MKKYFLIFAYVAFVASKQSSESSDSHSGSGENIHQFRPTVTLPQGKLNGIIQRTFEGEYILSFIGVRYAEAPINKLRFKPPVAVQRSSDEYDAGKVRPACPQPGNLLTDEDCLFINVHTRKIPKKGKNPKYPVIVYVHPGSFTTLSGNADYVGPQYLLDRKVVLVTFNYRLAALGFLSTGDKFSPGNNGMKDQVEALRWVKQNIIAFGGDPDCVTLAGYSVGGVSAALHLTSPMSKGLFHRIMIMSGSAFGNSILPSNQLELAQKQAKIVGCPVDTNENMMKCLQDVSAADLGNSLEKFRVYGTDPQFFWQFVLEPDFGQERFLTEHPLDAIRKGHVSDVPVFTGVTYDELVALAYPTVTNATALEIFNKDAYNIFPFAFYYDPYANNTDHITSQLRKYYFNGQPVNETSLIPLGELYSDGLAGFAVNRGARLLSEYLSNKVYYYTFTYRGRYSNFLPPGSNNKYVVHFDDQLYVFWNSLQFPKFIKSDPEALMVKKLTTLYYNFARYGNPTPTLKKKLDFVRWTAHSEQNGEYLDIGDVLQIKRDLFKKRYNIWDPLFPLPPLLNNTKTLSY
ncbi:hypothetical protein FQA39_LY00168 [Lamprigera yunnana]|nr:hypothetical protein FQA39_LY00168 [Lamprigera yunnana]